MEGGDGPEGIFTLLMFRSRGLSLKKSLKIVLTVKIYTIKSCSKIWLHFSVPLREGKKCVKCLPPPPLLIYEVFEQYVYIGTIFAPSIPLDSVANSMTVHYTISGLSTC